MYKRQTAGSEKISVVCACALTLKTSAWLASCVVTVTSSEVTETASPLSSEPVISAESVVGWVGVHSIVCSKVAPAADVYKRQGLTLAFLFLVGLQNVSRLAVFISAGVSIFLISIKHYIVMRVYSTLHRSGIYQRTTLLKMCIRDSVHSAA